MYNILQWFGNIVGEGSHGMKIGARDLEQGIVSAPTDSSPDLSYTDREETALSSTGSGDELLFQTSGPPGHEPADEPPAQSDSEATQTPGYSFTQENKIAVMENIVSVLLTEDTLRFMAKTIVENKDYQNFEIKYEEIKRKAAAGEAFIEVQQSEMEDADLAEDSREHARQALQDARARVLDNIRRRDEMESELGTRKANLEYARGQLDDIMEQLMTDVGVFERPAPEDQVDERRSSYDNEELIGEYPPPEDISESGSNEHTLHGARAYDSTVSATKTSAREARVRLESAAHRAILADDHFNRRHEGYLKDVQDLEHDHSRTEIDHYWVRKGAKLARELRDAEEEYDQARAAAKALGILANTSNQEFDFVDEEDDGYRESEDPICDVDQVNRSFIEAWTAKVQEERTVEHPLTPVIEWDAESVNISESVSAINGEAEWRKAIDKWHSQQESLRAQFTVLPESQQ